jgi:hypothetical protein
VVLIICVAYRVANGRVEARREENGWRHTRRLGSRELKRVARRKAKTKNERVGIDVEEQWTAQGDISSSGWMQHVEDARGTRSDLSAAWPKV